VDIERREGGIWDGSGRCQPHDCVLVFPSAGMGHGRAGTVARTRASLGEEEEADSQDPPISEEEREEGDAGCYHGSVGLEAGPRGRGKKGRGRWATLHARRKGGREREPSSSFLFLFPFLFARLPIKLF